MELQYYGANCVRIVTKKASITIDDNLSDLGAKPVTKPGDIALYTGPHASPDVEPKLIIDLPGEYEVSDTSIRGVGARAHIDEEGTVNTTIFKLIIEDIRIVVLGHIYPELNEEQLETLGTVDVLIIPVGGNGYTLDSIGALKLIKKIEPKLIIPTHYADSDLDYPVPQQQLDDAIRGLSMEPKETLPKLKLKANEIAEVSQLIILERQ